MARRVKFQKKRQNRLGMLCIFIVVTMLMVVLVFKSIELKRSCDEYAQREALLRKQIDEEHERTEKLVEYEKYTKTDKFVEEFAKEKLGLVYENEILFRSEDTK